MRAFSFRCNQYTFSFSPVLFRRYGAVVNSGIRIIFFILILLLFTQGCVEEPISSLEQTTPEYEGIIVAVGDSLTEGQGVTEELAYPALLQRKLQLENYRYRVINAGISGETSSGTLARIKWILTLKPDIVILVTGANDGFRGIDTELIRSNIRRTIQALKEKKVVVVLGGMQIVQNLGEDYTTVFANIYPDVARTENIILIPFFLSGVAANPSLNQADGIHPTEEGYRKIVDIIYPHVREAIERHRESGN